MITKNPRKPSPNEAKLLRFVESVLIKHELNIGIGLGVLFIIKLLGVELVAPFLVIGISFMAMLYYMSINLKTTGVPSQKNLFLAKLNYLAAAVAVIGIMFRIMSWGMADTLLMIGGLTCALLVIVATVQKNSDVAVKPDFLRNLYRNIILLAMSICAYYF